MDFAKVGPAKFGPQPTGDELKAAADNHHQATLFDPESKRVRWFDEQPRQAALWTGLVGGGWLYGWAMRFGLNAKNRFGGYVGEKPYYVMQAGGKVYVSEQPGDGMFQVRRDS